MQHKLPNIAANNNFNVDHFVSFCNTLKSSFFNIENGTVYVSSWYVNDIVNLYREATRNRFEEYLKHLGLTSSQIKRIPAGWEAIISIGLPDNIKTRFSRTDTNLVVLNYGDFLNTAILGDFIF